MTYSSEIIAEIDNRISSDEIKQSRVGKTIFEFCRNLVLGRDKLPDLAQKAEDLGVGLLIVIDGL